MLKYAQIAVLTVHTHYALIICLAKVILKLVSRKAQVTLRHALQQRSLLSKHLVVRHRAVNLTHLKGVRAIHRSRPQASSRIQSARYQVWYTAARNDSVLEGSSLLDQIILQVLLGHDGETVVWSELRLGQHLLLPLAPMLPPAALCYLSTLSTLRN